MTLYDRLSTASQSRRVEAAQRIVQDMQEGNAAASAAYWQVCDMVINQHDAHETEADAELPRWEFSADNSALLVRSVPRVSGFLNAIARAPEAHTIIDAGCGSSAILAIGAAVTHPRSRVIAYDINRPSVECAQIVTELFGLEDRIEIAVKDVTAGSLPDADLAVTETFSSGLFTELGHEITAALSQTSKEVLPAFAVVHASDTGPESVIWQAAAKIDFTVPNKEVRGNLISTGSGLRPIHVFAGYYDKRGVAVIDKLGANNLTNPVKLGEIAVPASGKQISFAYELGVEPHHASSQLQITG